MERLRTALGRNISAQEWKFVMGSFWVVFQNMAIAQIQYGVRKILETSKFFPAPAELLEATRNPFWDHKSGKPAFKDDLPEALPEEVRKAMIDRAESMGGFAKKATGEKTLAEIKADILARPPLVMTPEMEELEKALYRERMDNLERRLESKHG